MGRYMRPRSPISWWFTAVITSKSSRYHLSKSITSGRLSYLWLIGFKYLRHQNIGKETAKTAANHATDFEIPIYNIWKQQTKTEGSTHFGNSEVRWLDNAVNFFVN